MGTQPWHKGEGWHVVRTHVLKACGKWARFGSGNVVKAQVLHVKDI